MRFLFLLTQVEAAWTRAPAGEAERVYQAYMVLERELREQGKLLESIRLRPISEAKTLRNLAEGKRDLEDGPFVQAPEAIGGLYILECATVQEALIWAQRMPNYGHGSIEIRPIWD